MARTPEGPAPPPAVQKLRVRYAKRGRLRFTSHRDIQRALERAVRRAGVPVAYSAGFSPHPKISWAGAAPTGVASEAEYVEISLTRPVDPPSLRASLDAALPDGLDVLDVVPAGPGALADRLAASQWEIRLAGVDPATAAAAAAAFLAAERVEVSRLTKHGMRSFDARAAVLELDAAPDDTRGPTGATVADAPPCAILRAVVQHVTPAVRPDDVLSGLRQVADLAPPVPPAVTRLAQGPLGGTEGLAHPRVGDPLQPDRDAADAARETTG